jgi:hypothetical protein
MSQLSNIMTGVITAAAYVVSSVSVQAQLTSPEVTTFSAAASTRPISAAEAAHHVFMKDGRLRDANALRHTPDYPRDSIRTVLKATGREWLTRIQQRPIQGIQLDPSGRVGVSAEQEAYAKQQIAVRLATPGLSFDDRAYTYLLAVQAFADEDYPDRLPHAEAYLKQLDALGDSAAYLRYRARVALMSAYYTLGRSADVIRHGTSAIALGALIPFIYRGGALTDSPVYPTTVEALAGQPGGADKIAALNTTLLAALKASPALIAYENSYAALAQIYITKAKMMIEISAMLGKPAAPVMAQLWINRPTSDSATIAVNDGKIRILEVSDYACAACLQCLDGIERLHRAFPTAEVMFVTMTMGSWQNRLVEPAEEGQKLADFFVNFRKLTFPIGVVLRPKSLNVDGGMTPQSESPNELAYPHMVRPTFWVIDGNGKIRRILTGAGENTEAQLARTVTFLQREASGAAATKTAMTAVPAAIMTAATMQH